MHSPDTDHQRTRILVIDDDVSVARAFGLALTGAGYQVLIAHEANTALEQVRRYAPAAIVLDFQMPFVNGAGFLYRLRTLEMAQCTPVMMVTGCVVTDALQTELRNLGTQLFYKPIGVAELVASVRAVIEGAKAKA